jgi:hypothetical protein
LSGGVAGDNYEIHVRGRVYTYSRHFIQNLPTRPEATKEYIEYVLLNPSYQERQGPRRIIYWRYVPGLGKHMKVVEDQLPTGELQILSAHCPRQNPPDEATLE